MERMECTCFLIIIIYILFLSINFNLNDLTLVDYYPIIPCNRTIVLIYVYKFFEKDSFRSEQYNVQIPIKFYLLRD